MVKFLLVLFSAFAVCGAYGSMAEIVPGAFGGIYVGAPYKLDVRHQLPDEIYSMPEIAGVYLRLPWNVIEPTPSQFQWAAFDTELNHAVRAGKKISLAVLAGRYAPAWLEDQGVRMNSFTVGQGGIRRTCGPVRIPLPWDRQYQDAYIHIMNSLADHLRLQPKAYQAVKIVKISPFSQSTEELRVPMTPPNPSARAAIDPCASLDATQTWKNAGYQPQLIVAAWTRVAQGVAKAFPDKVLAIDILERNDFPRIADVGNNGDDPAVKESIIRTGIARFPGRFAVQWDGLSRSSVEPVTQNAGKQGAIIGFSTNAFRGPEGAGCDASRREFILGGREAAPCDAEGFRALLKHGTDQNARYMEIWPVDALRFRGVVADVNRQLSGR